ncbi:MAG: hypothetical protein DMG65_09110 [Candidatus Angelobacter sp. Gp1-AA117]|nr:MAG: hypothetical protein DMG65_09110 [Candidatus Angelobacter sp. Gp1-AA117]
MSGLLVGEENPGMAYIHRIIGCTAVLLALMSPCADAYGQQAAPEAALTLDQLVGAARRYFRDTAEFLRGAKMFKISAGNAFWTMLPGIVLSADPSGYVFAAQPTDPAASLLNAQLTSSKPCPALTMTGKVLFYLPDEVCGTSSFAVHNDLSFHKFAFDVAGLPAPVKISPFGRCMLQRYRVEIEFQSVTLPGDKEPFLVPKQSSAHLETDKGAIVITSVFEPKK